MIRALALGLALSALALPAARAEGPAYEAAVGLRRAGNYREAAQAFESLASSDPRGPDAHRALSAAAALYLHELGQPDHARALYDRILEHSVEDGPGVREAINGRLAIESEHGGPREEVRLLHKIFEHRAHTEYAPYLLLRAARILGDELHQPQAALEPLGRLIEHFPTCPLADDASIEQARFLRQLGRGQEALRSYRRIIDTQRDSLIVGEYDSDRLDDAYYGLAATLAELGRRDDARGAYEALVREVPESRFVDDALYQAARLAEQAGDAAAAADLRARLKTLRPDSRYLRGARS